MAQRLRLDDVQWDTDGRTLVWLEGRSGQSVLVARREGDAPRDVTDVLSVRAGVGYGGGDFTVGHGQVVFATREGRLYRQRLDGGVASPITPAFGQVASPAISPDGRWVIFVHSYERVDVLALVDVEGSLWPLKLVSGSDFYMQPTWHSAGDRIAWVEWDHPNMPWDSTRLCWARLEGDPPRLVERTVVEDDPDRAVFQPAFSPDGRWLSYIVTQGEWDALKVIDLETGQAHILIEGTTLADPAWIQGMRTYAWRHDGGAIYYRRNDAGVATLWRVDLSSGRSEPIDISPYTWITQITAAPTADRLAFLASSPQVPDRVVTWEDGLIRVEKRSSSESIPMEDLPQPEALEWPAEDGTTIHGLYYRPVNSAYEGMGLPPVIVNVHGGPTGQRTASFSSDVAFFTHRGYGFLEVNYRGSTGYGRSYMTALRGHWGDYDVRDVVSAAEMLIRRGLADPGRLVVKGGSAGGYTVLNVLIRHPGLFKAGICLYGVTNLFTLATDTHKFEERYLDSLVGPLPDAAARYREWSPIFQADRLRDPIAIFQGAEDQVVPPDQAESIVAVLRSNRVPHVYRLFEGEGHGWRKAETIEAYYREVERFLRQYVIFG